MGASVASALRSLPLNSKTGLDEWPSLSFHPQNSVTLILRVEIQGPRTSCWGSSFWPEASVGIIDSVKEIAVTGNPSAYS